MNYRNPKYCIDGIRIDCEIEHPVYGWIPFTCDPKDTGAEFDVVELYKTIVRDGFVAKMSEEEIDEILGAEVRSVRDSKLLGEIDPIVTNPLRWSDLSQEEKLELSLYRRQLLDIPQQPGFPRSVIWPVKAQ